LPDISESVQCGRQERLNKPHDFNGHLVISEGLCGMRDDAVQAGENFEQKFGFR
jgi:hypothetical protein